MVRRVEDECGNWSAYSLQYVRKIADACDTKTPEEITDLYDQIGEYCQTI